MSEQKEYDIFLPYHHYLLPLGFPYQVSTSMTVVVHFSMSKFDPQKLKNAPAPKTAEKRLKNG